MILLRPFDYVAYSVGCFYSEKWGYKNDEKFVGALFVAMLQYFNFLTIAGTDRLLNLFKVNGAYVFLGGILPFLIFNLARYYKFVHYANSNKKWNREIDRLRTKKQVGVIIYIVFTFLSFFLFGQR